MIDIIFYTTSFALLLLVLCVKFFGVNATKIVIERTVSVFIILCMAMLIAFVVRMIEVLS